MFSLGSSDDNDPSSMECDLEGERMGLRAEQLMYDTSRLCQILNLADFEDSDIDDSPPPERTTIHIGETHSIITIDIVKTHQQ